MNRFVREGIVREGQGGECVLCIIPSREVPYVLNAIATSSYGVSSVRRAHGDQSITFDSGGKITFAHPERGDLRGHAADIVVIDDVYYRDSMQAIFEELRPALSVSDGEIITYT